MKHLGNDILQVFSAIPKEQILGAAAAIQQQLRQNPALVQRKQGDEVVTAADLEIQRILLEHFAGSSLAGTYCIKSEERCAQAEKEQGKRDKQWQLLIDPLDGTNSFIKGEDSWGTMAGCCDMAGRLVYSWNLLSDGVIYQGGSLSRLAANAEPVDYTAPSSWEEKYSSGKEVLLDIYDYQSGAKNQVLKYLPAKRFAIKQYVSAIWAGWAIYSGAIDGLLWLSSEKGKGSYPDYDLIFTAALKAKGWQVALGKREQRVMMLVVAPGEEELKLLWDCGMKIMPKDGQREMERNMELHITEPG